MSEPIRDEASKLVEALGHRFVVAVKYPSGGPAPPWLGMSRNDREYWSSVAKECLRQMEWARSECVESVDSFDAGNSWLSNKPMTLAPPEWAP